MRIEIPFNEIDFRKQMLFLFDNAYHKHLHTNKINFYYGLFFLFVACISYFQLYVDSNLPIISFITGMFFLGISSNYYIQYKTKKKTYITQIDKEIEEHLRSNQIGIFEFNEEFIRWEDFKLNFKISWQGVKYFEQKEDYIIIGIAPKNPLIIISKKEVHDYLEEILELAKKKAIN